ncbi:MAG: hypothetical protein ACJAYE_002076 [Candidatus Azotimanducaceae bacterium]|jgi:hypothetical protein
MTTLKGMMFNSIETDFIASGTPLLAFSAACFSALLLAGLLLRLPL